MTGREFRGCRTRWIVLAADLFALGALTWRGLYLAAVFIGIATLAHLAGWRWR